MKNKYILTITLNPAVDKTIYCENFSVDQDHRSSDIHCSAGGKGINVSRVLNTLKVPTVASGCIGGNNGSYILDELQQEGIEQNFLTIKGDTRTSLTIIDRLSQTNTRVLECGPDVSPQERIAFMQIFSELITDASWVVLSGRSLLGIGDDFYQKLIEISKHHNINSVLDTSGEHFKKALASKPNLVKPNVQEAEELLGYKIGDINMMMKACKDIKNLGAELVCLSDGKNGAVFFDGLCFFHGSVPDVHQESPVGCGDAFIAGFLAANYQGKNSQESFLNALACGTANALNNQPGKINIKELMDIIPQIKICRI